MIDIDKLEINDYYKNRLSHFQNYLMMVKKFDVNSNDSYMYDIIKYFKYLDKLNIRDLYNIDTINNYLTFLSKSNINTSSILRCITSILFKPIVLSILFKYSSIFSIVSR